MIDIKEADLRKCCECTNATQIESFHDKEGNLHPLWKCGKHRQFITEFTLVGWTCKGVDYKKRGEK